MRTKGVGPQGLGVANVSPLKQTKKQQSIMQNEDGSPYTGQSKSMFGHVKEDFPEPVKLPAYTGKWKPTQTGAVAPVFDLTDMLTGGPIGGLAKKAAVAGIVRSGVVNSVKKGFSKLFGSSKNQKALDAFIKASPKDPTKTTKLSSYNSKNQKALDAFMKASPKDPTKTTRLSNYNN